MKQDNRQTQLILCLFGIFPVVWLGLLMAPAVSGASRRSSPPSLRR